jgi:hypothetical protein
MGWKKKGCVRAGDRSCADKEANALGELVGEVPVGEVQGHGLAEEGLTDADEEAADVERGRAEGAGLACGGDGPD